MKTKGIQLWPSMKAVNILNLLCAAVLVAGLEKWGVSSCSAAEGTPSGAAVLGVPLRVGITPEYPPLVFRQPDGTNGLEIDFAKALGLELGRPVQFVVLRWDELPGALLERQIDIIMSGMSVTKARQLKVRFSDPYVRNELRAIFPLTQADHFKTVEDLQTTKAKIGVVTGSTSDAYVKQNCPNAEIVRVAGSRDVPIWLLQTKRMDVFVDDSYALADILSKHVADIAYLPQPLSEEDLAWAVRPDDTEFLAKVNSILTKWKSDGTLDRLLDRWLPYLKNLRVQKPPAQPK